MKTLFSILLSAFLVTAPLSVNPAEPQQPKLSPTLTDNQKDLLNLAFTIAKKDGHEYPHLLQGIIFLESRAGEVRTGKKPTSYYGVGQIKVGAARDVLNRFPKMKARFGPALKTDEQIKKRLIEDDVFNLAVASKYILIMKTYGFKTARQLALAYNQGPGGAKRFDEETHYYPSKVMKAIQKIHK